MAEWDWSRIVFDHVQIGVRDAEASKRFYGTVLAALEIPSLWESDRGAQYANLVVSGTAEETAPLHTGFVARSREEVDAFHRVGIDAGFRDNGEPGVREQYSSEEAGLYYAAFLLDPDRYFLHIDLGLNRPRHDRFPKPVRLFDSAGASFGTRRGHPRTVKSHGAPNARPSHQVTPSLTADLVRTILG